MARYQKLRDTGVSVLFLTAFIICDSSLLNETLTVPETCQNVESDLNKVMNMTTCLCGIPTDENVICGNYVLHITKKLVSTLVRKTNTFKSIRISLQTLEVDLIMVGPNSSVKKIPALITRNASMDTKLIGSSNNNQAAVAFISFINMRCILKPDFYKTFVITSKFIMAAVSATLPQTTNTDHPTPVTLTFVHIGELKAIGVLSCVYWRKTEWVKDGCSITQKNSTHTVCSCRHLGTFALIMETYPWKMQDSDIKFFTESLAVGMTFLTLSALTLGLCRPYMNNTNMALINLCISLLLAFLVSLVPIHFPSYVCPRQDFLVLAGVLIFFYLSAGMWMVIEAVLLFIFVMNLSKVRSSQREGLSWKWLIVIGYFIPLVLVVMYALIFHGFYIKFLCRVNLSLPEKILFNIPFYIIIVSNMIIFIIIIIIIILTLTWLKNNTLQTSNTTDRKLLMSVMFKSLAQFFILGCCWIVYFIPEYDGTVYYVFMFFSSQQGTFIFLVHCLLNQQVRQQYRKFLCALWSFTSRNTATADVQLTQRTE